MTLSCGSNLDDPDTSPGNAGVPEFVPPVMLEEPSVDDSTSPEPGREASGSQLNFGVSDERTNEVEVVCAAQSAASELQSVYLAFAFDVSGSMGGNNELLYTTKWLPVVAATEGFFSEPESAAISVSMTFFPGADEGTRCTDAAYLVPDVPHTLLPSTAFADAIAALNYTLGSPAWRGSTPTLAAFNGTAASLHAITDDAANTRAVVMVTDGVPAGCDGVNDVQLVANAVRSSGLKTFVIGVANPPGSNDGDNLLNLNVIAAAGGTEHAFIVETGDPAQTEANFKSVIDDIRGIAISCNIAIPLPPNGTAFIPEQVNVTYGSGGATEVPLTYDPDCGAANTWRYDSPNDPTTIVLCDNTCGTVKADAAARLSVEFGCERRGVPR